jgi:hypothetical protein
LELRKAHKEKGVRPSREPTKSMKTWMLDPFIGKETKAKNVKQWVLQVEPYFESQVINKDVDQFRLARSFLRDHALEWWTTLKDVDPNQMGILPCNAFKAKLNERFTPHNQIFKDG